MYERLPGWRQYLDGVILNPSVYMYVPLIQKLYPLVKIILLFKIKISNLCFIWHSYELTTSLFWEQK